MTPLPFRASAFRRRRFLILVGSIAAVLAGPTAHAVNTEDDVLAGATDLGINTAGTTYTATAGTTSDVTFAAATVYSNAGNLLLSTPLSIGSLNVLTPTALTINGTALLTLSVLTGANVVAPANSGNSADSLFVASGGSLTINNTGGIAITNSSSFDAIGSLNLGTTGINIAAGKVLSLTGAGATTLNGVIAATTGAVLVNKGSGTVTFGGANLYTGGTTITAGTLKLSSAGTLGSVNNTLTVNGGALDLSGTSQGVGNFTGIGGTIYNLSGGGTSTLTIGNNNGNGGVFAGLIADNDDVTTGGKVAVSKTGTGTIQLTGANTYTGGTTISGGGLYAQTSLPNNADLALGTGLVTLNGGTLYLKANGSGNTQSIITGNGTVGNNVTVGGNTTIDVNQSAVSGVNTGNTFVFNNLSVGANTLNVTAGNTYALRFAGTTTLTGNATFNPTTGNLTLAGNIGDGGNAFSLTKTGAGTLTLSGTNTYTGATTISAGILSAQGAGALPSGSAVIMGAGTLQISNDGAGSNGTISLGNTITSNGAVTATIAVGNNGSANTGNTVAFGALSNGTSAQAFNATFTFTGANGYLQSFTSLTLAGLGGGGTTLNPTSTSVTISGNVTNQITTNPPTGKFDTLTLSGTTTGNAINGVIADNANYVSVGNGDTRVTASGTGSWTLAGANTYHGPTAISAGTLNLTGSLANTQSVVTSGTGAFTESSAGVIGGTASFTQGSSGTSALAGANTYTGATSVSAGTLNLTGSLGNTVSVTISGTGVLSESSTGAIGGAATLTHSSSGTSVLAGANTYTGATSISAGTLNLTGSLTNTSAITTSGTGVFTQGTAGSISGSASFTQNSSGLSVLSGTNTYTGATTISAGILEFANTAAQPTGNTTVGTNGTLALAVGGVGQFTAANVNQYLTNTLARVSTVTRQLGIDTAAGDFDLGGLSLPTRSAVSINKLGANALNLGAITRSAASTVNFAVTAGTLTTTTANTGTSILGGYATFGGSTWAVSAANGTDPAGITGLASGSYFASVAGTTAPGTTADVDFQASNTTAYTAQTINSLRFNTAAATTLTLSGANVITTGGVLVTSAVGGNGSSISGGTLAGSAGGELILINNNTSGGLSIGSTIVNNGTATGLTKSGSGSLTLSAVNTYSGATVINAGTVVLSSTAGMPNTSAVVLGSGTTVSFARNTNQGTLFGSAIISGAGGIIENINNPNQSMSLDRANTYTGPTLLNIRGGFTAGVASVYDGSGNQISGAFGVNSAIQMTAGGPILFLNGNNNQVGSLSGSSGNVYLGRAAGGASAILTIGGDNTSTSFGVVISDTHLGNNSSANSAVTIGGQIIKIGTGTQTFTANNLYGGATTIAGGTLAISTIGNGGAQTTGSTSGSSTTLTVASTAGIVAGQLVYGAGTQGGTTVSAVNVGSVTLSTAVTVGTGSALSFGNGNGIGISSNAASNLVLDNGTLQYIGTVVGNTDRLFQIGRSTDTGSATGTIDSSSVLAANALSFTNAGAVTYGKVDQADTLALTGSNTGVNTLAPAIGDNGTGAVSVTKSGVGAWTLSGTNSYSGGTTLTNGTLTGSVTGAFGSGNVTVSPSGTTAAGSATLNSTGSIGANANVTVNSNALAIGTLNFNGSTPSIGSLSGNGKVVLNNAGGTNLTIAGGISGNANSTFSGAISDLGAGSLTSSTSGKVTLSGTSTYVGGTNVTAGTLEVSGRLTGTTAVNATGGTLRLNNNVSNVINPLSTLTIGSGGTLALADAVNGKSQTFGALTLSGSTTLDFGNGAAGNALLFSPTATFSGTLSIWNWTAGAYAGGADTGSIGDGQDRLLFAGVGSGFTADQLASITFYSDNGITALGSGTEVAFGSGFEIVAVPEPSSLALFGTLALLGLGGSRRRARSRRAAGVSRA